MILRFTLPDLELGALSTRMHKWQKAEGDQISYGDDICEVLVEETRTLVRKKHASELLHEQADPKVAAPQTHGSGSRVANYIVRIVSSDLGYLRRIYATEGEAVASGQTLAVLTTERSEDLSEDQLGAQPVFRAISDYEVDDPYG